MFKHLHISRETPKKPPVPCYGCADRKVGCHIECGKYNTYKQESERLMSEYQKAINAERIRTGYFCEQRSKQR
jgi:hypothetical protein